MNHEQFIELETAELAKQAGFDWETYTMYISELNESKLHRYEYKPFNWNKPRRDFEKDGSDNLFHAFIDQNKEDNSFYSAPTQSVLQRWLREVKHLNISISYDPTIKTQPYIYEIYDMDEKIDDIFGNISPVTHSYSDGYFYTYEETLEVGLQKCLTLIIESHE